MNMHFCKNTIKIKHEAYIVGDEVWGVIVNKELVYLKYGTKDYVDICFPEIFEAIWPSKNATLFHTHPIGSSVDPSADDIQIAATWSEMFYERGVTIQDFIIFGVHQRTFSFKYDWCKFERYVVKTLSNIKKGLQQCSSYSMEILQAQLFAIYNYSSTIKTYLCPSRKRQWL